MAGMLYRCPEFAATVTAIRLTRSAEILSRMQLQAAAAPEPPSGSPKQL